MVKKSFKKGKIFDVDDLSNDLSIIRSCCSEDQFVQYMGSLVGLSRGRLSKKISDDCCTIVGASEVLTKLFDSRYVFGSGKSLFFEVPDKFSLVCCDAYFDSNDDLISPKDILDDDGVIVKK